jgi:DNA-binding transcriptional LysR family regulator
MDLNLISAFIDVARGGSFAAAARQRASDPSTMSRMVASLETELGFRLFNRTTRRLSLTEAGEIYLSRIEPSLKELDDARDQARALNGAPAGRLRMSASVAFAQICIVPLLPLFRQAYPDIRLDLELCDARQDLVANRIDLAIRLGHRIESGLIAAKLFDTNYRIVASPAYVEREGPLVSPQDLSSRNCLLFNLPDYRSSWLVRDEKGETTEVPVMGDLMMSSGLALKQAALDGLGPALMAEWLIDRELASGRLVDLLPGHVAAATSFDRAAWAVYPNRQHLPQKVRVTIDFLKRHLGRR